jgi:hypothetical protein
MLYKIPLPTRSNGVKILKLNDHQIGVEYTRGEPVIGKMAFDSQCGIMSRNITFVARDDAMPKAGKPPIGNNDMAKTDDDYSNYSDSNSEGTVAKVIAFLTDLISSDDLEIVHGLLSGADQDEAAEAQHQATDRRRVARLAADQARRRPMSSATEREYSELFPQAGRLG